MVQFVKYEGNKNKWKLEGTSILSVVESLTAAQMAKLKDARDKYGFNINGINRREDYSQLKSQLKSHGTII